MKEQFPKYKDDQNEKIATAIEQYILFKLKNIKTTDSNYFMLEALMEMAKAAELIRKGLV